jgi:cupin fold WbuC family metalloprotein
MAGNRLDRFIKHSDEVLYARGSIVDVDRGDIDALISQAESNPRRRIRICAHPDAADPLHEMLIVHARDTYVRPHKHLGKSESFHVVAGIVDVVLLDDDGRFARVIPMGEYGSGRAFFYRLSTACYHTLRITANFAVFHETTSGPFRREDTVFAPWAPAESELEAVRAYQERIAAFCDAAPSPPASGKRG